MHKFSPRFQTRSILPTDAQNYSDWLKADARINLVDPKVYSYPTCISLVVDKGDEAILMNSFHAVIVVNKDFTTQAVPMIEALAVRPGARPEDVAQACVELCDGIKKISGNFGIREIWLQSIDERFQRFLERHLEFDRVQEPLMRLCLDEKRIIDDPLAYLVAHITQVREIWQYPVDEEHQKFLEARGFKSVVVPTYRRKIGSEDDPLNFNIQDSEATHVQV